jgi:hypothetical protein
LFEHNVYVKQYKYAFERIREEEQRLRVENPTSTDINVVARLQVSTARDQRRYNLPTANEIAVVIGDGANPGAHRDIVLELRQGGAKKRIYDSHPAYQPLVYVLLFPRGEHGWHPGIPLNITEAAAGQRREQEDTVDEQAEGRGKQTIVSQLEYYAFRFHPRPQAIESMHLFVAQMLFQQYICDAWAATDQSRLRWLRNNQDKLRTEIVKGFVDAVAGNADVNLQNIGQRFILPSSYIGGARHMYQLLLDSLALARVFGSPDYFLTVTANPRWPEIVAELLPGQKPQDRPDLISRVFREKIRILMNKIKKGLLGKYRAFVYSIEFQKRGLPHIHILIWIHPNDKINSPESVDQVISAEIPDPETHRRLHKWVTSVMIHGPCGEQNPDAPCMKNGRCTKGYPKSFQETTITGNDGYPIYQCRNNGRTFTTRDGKVVDNQWVVPYSPMLILLLECHANLELCISVRAFKYIHKYVYKGHDRATMGLGENDDEIQQHLDARYVSASEAIWRLFRYAMHDEEPNVVRLQVHLPGEQTITFSESDNPLAVAERASRAKSTLTAFFDANREEEASGNDVWLARNLLYQEFPQKFVFGQKTKKWSVRKKGFALGRMYYVHPTAGERFYLRLLLTVVPGW